MKPESSSFSGLAPLVQWFITTPPPIPPLPFDLTPYHRVVNPPLFWAALANQCRIYPTGRPVGLKHDLLALKTLTERNAAA